MNVLENIIIGVIQSTISFTLHLVYRKFSKNNYIRKTVQWRNLIYRKSIVSCCFHAKATLTNCELTGREDWFPMQGFLELSLISGQMNVLIEIQS